MLYLRRYVLSTITNFFDPYTLFILKNIIYQLIKKDNKFKL